MSKEKFTLKFTLDDLLFMFRRSFYLNKEKTRYFVEDEEVFKILRKNCKAFNKLISDINVERLKEYKARKDAFKVLVKRLTNKDVFIDSLYSRNIFYNMGLNYSKLKPVKINGVKKVWTKEAESFINQAHNDLLFKAKFLGRSPTGKFNVCLEFPYGIVIHVDSLSLKETKEITYYVETEPNCFEKRHVPIK